MCWFRTFWRKMCWFAFFLKLVWCLGSQILNFHPRAFSQLFFCVSRRYEFWNPLYFRFALFSTHLSAYKDVANFHRSVHWKFFFKNFCPESRTGGRRELQGIEGWCQSALSQIFFQKSASWNQTPKPPLVEFPHCVYESARFCNAFNPATTVALGLDLDA